MDEFTTGSATHLVTVIVSVVVMAAFVLTGRRAGVAAERRIRRGWALAIFALGAFLLARSLAPSTFDARWNLPLHLCDLALPITGLALWTERRGLEAITYFWGAGLSTQTFVTPILHLGPAHPEFWYFWLYHVQVVGAAAYLIAVRGFRPTGRDFRIAWLSALVYVALVVPLNLAFDWNYGFLGRDEALIEGTLLEWFPPWPWRIACVVLVVSLWFLLLWPLGRLFGSPGASRELPGTAPD